MADHLTRADLQAGLPHILGSPGDDGVLEAIVIRPDHGRREELESCEISLAAAPTAITGPRAAGCPPTMANLTRTSRSAS